MPTASRSFLTENSHTIPQPTSKFKRQSSVLSWSEHSRHCSVGLVLECLGTELQPVAQNSNRLIVVNCGLLVYHTLYTPSNDWQLKPIVSKLPVHHPKRWFTGGQQSRPYRDFAFETFSSSKAGATRLSLLFQHLHGSCSPNPVGFVTPQAAKLLFLNSCS